MWWATAILQGVPRSLSREARTCSKASYRILRPASSTPVLQAFARAAAGAFATQLDPTCEELADIKTAVSEAVTNCIVHAYRDTVGEIRMAARLLSDGEGGTLVEVEIKDRGCGIPDVTCARQPLYTTDAEGERSGMGFTVMESFTDALKVTSKVGQGTTVTMWKKLSERGRI